MKAGDEGTIEVQERTHERTLLAAPPAAASDLLLAGGLPAALRSWWTLLALAHNGHGVSTEPPRAGPAMAAARSQAQQSAARLLLHNHEQPVSSCVLCPAAVPVE
eukprot:SAG25_NODE_1056_length_4167_cov_3.576450_1_plen_105_part_00